jgi:hypothetical protein
MKFLMRTLDRTDFFKKSHSDHGGHSPPYISPSCFEGSVGWAVPTDFMKMALESMKFHIKVSVKGGPPLLNP